MNWITESQVRFRLKMGLAQQHCSFTQNKTGACTAHTVIGLIAKVQLIF
jgi:hypothetical protein